MKLEIKENMYYRTRGSAIGKIVSLEDLNEREYRLNGFYINKNSIKNASYNIIDILEVGDYVNGHEVKMKQSGFNIIDIGEDENYVWLYEKNIKTIVTKEQFEQISYRMVGK